MIYKPSNKSSHNNSYSENQKIVQGQNSTQGSAKQQKSCQQDQTQLLVWGYDSSGQLGLGSKQQGKDNNSIIISIQLFQNKGGNCYFSPKYCCFNISIKQISCGQDHSGLLAHNGNVYMIGSNKQGQLGIGSRETLSRSVPVLLDSLGKHTIIKLSCGGNHTGAITSRGFVFMWGEGNEGQLGTGSIENIYQPTQLNLFNSRYISCGKKNTIVLSGQKAYGFGDCKQGQLGTGKKVNEFNPTEIPLPSFDGHIKSVSCGDNHTIFLSDQGEMFSCGNNSFGQLGVGQEAKSSTYLIKVHFKPQFKSKIITVKAGYMPFSMALSDDGKLYIWGTGFFGYYDEPKAVNNSENVTWRNVSLGNNVICLTDDQGRAYSWGQNIKGELGLGQNSSYQQQYPQQIEINMNDKIVQKVESGQHYSFAILANKTNNPFTLNETDILNSSENKNSFISTQQRSSINRKHAMLAEQISQFSQQLQKFQNDYPTQNTNHDCTNSSEVIPQKENINFPEKRQVQNVKLDYIERMNNSHNTSNILQLDNIEYGNDEDTSQQLRKQCRSISMGANSNITQNVKDNMIYTRINTQQEQSNENNKFYYTSSNGKIKLDQFIPNYLSNNRVLTESADFSSKLNQTQTQQPKVSKNQLNSSLLSNQLFSYQSVQSHQANVNPHSESIQQQQLKCNMNQSFDHLNQYKVDDNILNISDIAIDQSEFMQANNILIQNQYLSPDISNQNSQQEQIKYPINDQGKNIYSFLSSKQEQNHNLNLTQQSQNNQDKMKLQNNSFVGKVVDIQQKYQNIVKQLEISQKENKILKQQISEEKNKNVNLQIRLDQLGKKSKQQEKKNELLMLEIDMNKKTYEMKCEALLKQLYNYQSLEPIQDKYTNSIKKQHGQYETLLDNFITINENGQNNILDFSNSQVKNLQTFAETDGSTSQHNKENIEMNIQASRDISKFQSQNESKKGSISQENDSYQKLSSLNNQFPNYINTNMFDMKDILFQTNPQSPFSTTNASKKLTMKLNQLNLINRSNQIGVGNSQNKYQNHSYQ